MNRPKSPLERKLIRPVLKGQTDPEQLARALRVPLEEVAITHAKRSCYAKRWGS